VIYDNSTLKIENKSVIFKQGYVYSISPLRYEKNHEYFLKTQNLGSEYILLKKGILNKDEMTDFSTFTLKVNKFRLSVEKYVICREVNCVSTDLVNFYNDTNVGSIYLKFNIFQNGLDINTVNFFKISNIPGLGLTQDQNLSKTILKKLKENTWIDYYNEIISFADLRVTLLNHIYKNKNYLRIKDLLNIIQTSKNEFLKLKAIKDDLKRLFFLRNNMFQVSRRKKVIFIKNIIFSLDKMKDISIDQFSKLKKHLISDKEEVIEEKVKVITYKELIENNGEPGKRLWILISDKVYDVTNFPHPGGVHLYKEKFGKDRFADFNSVHRPNSRAVMERDRLFVGNIENIK